MVKVRTVPSDERSEANHRAESRAADTTPTERHAGRREDGGARLPAARVLALPLAPGETAGCVIERLILHQTAQDQPAPLLAAAPAHLDAASAAWFAAYVSEAERRADWHARLAQPDGEISRLCAALFQTPEDFVVASRTLATCLHSQMRARRQIAPGDFVALIYRTPAGRAAALLKLDPDEHRLVRRFAGPPERRHVRIHLAKGLLPDARALQKCALLSPRLVSPRPPDDGAGIEREGFPAQPFTIRLLDTQAGPRSEGVAAFFYRGFLGAELLPSARRVTRCFLTVTEHWLGAHLAEVGIDEVLRFYAARRSALTRGHIDLDRYAREALPQRSELAASLVGAVTQALADLGMRAPFPPLPVDATVAAPVLRAVTLILDGNARLTVPAEGFARLVREVTRRPDGTIRLVIETLTLSEGGYL